MNQKSTDALIEELLDSCHRAGLDIQKFLTEKIFELSERRRILFTPHKAWFLTNSASLSKYLRKVTGRNLSGIEIANLRAGLREFYSPENRQAINSKEIENKIQEQNKRCRICGAPISQENCVVDHITPVGGGGLSRNSNYQLTCEKCNSGKSDSANYAALTPWRISNSELRTGPTLSPKVRYAVLARDSNQCSQCSKSSLEVALYVRREIPENEGGQIVFDNLITICETCLCARANGSQLADEWQ